VLGLVIVLYVLSRTVQQVARAVPDHWQILLGLTALDVLLVLIAFFANPLDVLGTYGSAGWGAGAFIGLLAALAALAGGIMRLLENRGAPAAGQPLPGPAA
jgi:hypothetical protein